MLRAGLPQEASTAWMADWLGEPGRSGGYRGGGDYPEWAAAWVATPVLALAFAGAFSPHGPLKRRTLVLAVGAGAWLLALRMPGIRELFALLPGVGLSATARVGVVSSLMLSLLAGEALQAASRPACLIAAGCGLVWMLSCAFLPPAPALPVDSSSDSSELAGLVGFLEKPEGRVGGEAIEVSGWVHPSLSVESMSLRIEAVSGSEGGVSSFSAPLAISSFPRAGDSAAGAPAGARYFATTHAPVDRLAGGSWRLVVELYGRSLDGEPVLLGEHGAGICTVQRTGGLTRPTLLFIAASLLCIALSPPRRRLPVWIVSLAQILWFAHGKNPAVPRSECFPPTACERLVEREQGVHRFLSDPGILPANTGLLHRLRALDGYDAMDVASFNLFRPYALKPFTQALLGWNASGVDLESPAFRLLGARLLLTHGKLEHPGFEWIAGPDPTAPEAAEVNVYRARDPMPRVFCVPEVIEREDVLADLASFDPARSAFLEEGALWRPAQPFQSSRTSDLQVSNNRISVRVWLDGDGLLLFTEQFFPGWKASIDGKEAPILAADSIFRAVPLAAGEHRVELTYAPSSLLLGAAVSALAALFLVILWKR
jgi:hypothetical protein